MRSLVLVLLVGIGLAVTAAPAHAGDLMSCSYTDGSSTASASGDVAVCGPCLLRGGACASAVDLPIN